MRQLPVLLLVVFYSILGMLTLIEAGPPAERGVRKSSRRGKGSAVLAATVGKFNMSRLQQLPTSDSRPFPLMNRPPRRKQLNQRELMNIIGVDFNSEWMSIDKPRALVIEPRADSLPPPDNKMWNDLKKLNLTHALRTSQTHEALPEESVASFERWLLGRASCAVRYVWEDIGPYFWPRWIRRGDCVNTNDRPCSWPPGMHCVPAESLTLHVLHWHCQPAPGTPKRQGSGLLSAAGRPTSVSIPQEALKCHWMRVPYPVTSDCFCSC